MSGPTPRLLGGRYEVGELIGRGGMAEVHRGHDARLGREVAIKILRADHARDASFLHRFRREAQSVAGLNHRSIVAVYDSGEDRVTESGGASLDIPYIVMEYVQGRTLREVLNEQGQLAPAEAAQVTEAVLDALAYSHQMGIIHRDIKPGNVMVGDDGDIKVMDFGIARAVADAQATMTQTQAVIGTAQYISPEQARGETVDNRSDIYSTGCLLFELLTGRTPFVGEPISLTYQHVSATPPSPSELQSEVPVELDAIVAHALGKGREDRYQDASEMADDLRAYQRGLPISEAAAASLGAVIPDAGMTEVMSPTSAVAAAGGAGYGAEEPPTAVQAAIPPEDERRAEPKRRGGAAGWILAGLLLVALAGLGLYAWANSGDDPDVPLITVEDYVGDDGQAAEAAANAAGLDATIEQQASADVDEGLVISQDPEGGEEVERGSQIVLTVSSGPDAVEVPDLTGRGQNEARQILEGRGLSVGEVTTEDDPEVGENRVISSSPGAGESVEPGGTVDLVISSGQVELPDVTGRNVDDVRFELGQLGLSVETTLVESEETEGNVISQNPGAGRVRVGSTVQLEVAKPQTETTPPETETSPPETETSPPETESPTGTESLEPTEPSTPPNTGDPETPPDP